MSHPMWVRGLKQKLCGRYRSRFRVAPYVGAWIETISTKIYCKSLEVAPYVGAWIETFVISVALYHFKSHPMWVRGLKQNRF